MRRADPTRADMVLRGRVVVVQPRPGLGDLIWHLPLIRALAARSGSGRVVLVAKPSTQAEALLAGDPAIERVVAFDRNPRQGRGRHDGPLGFPRLVASLRGCGAQSGVLLHHGASLALAMRLAGIADRYGYGSSPAQRRWLNRGPFLPPAAPFTEAFEQAHAYAEAAGLTCLAEPSVAVEPAALRRVQARLAGLPQPWTVLGIGSNGAVRQWGAEPFAQLGTAILAAGSGSVVLLASAQEAALSAEVAGTMSGGCRVVEALGWPLGEVAALLSEAATFVGNDSGPMNLRAAVGRTAVALFGASGPLLHSRHIVGVVPAGGPRAGMAAIGLQDVLEKVRPGPSPLEPAGAGCPRPLDPV